jgi:hypothetical protein
MSRIAGQKSNKCLLWRCLAQDPNSQFLLSIVPQLYRHFAELLPEQKRPGYSFSIDSRRALSPIHPLECFCRSGLALLSNVFGDLLELDSTRVVVLAGERAGNPPFYLALLEKKSGIGEHP